LCFFRWYIEFLNFRYTLDFQRV